MAAPMLVGRGGTAAAAIDDRIYVIGGEGNTAVPSGVFPDVTVYDATADAWETLAPMQTPRHGTGAASVDGVIYVPGGADTQGFGAVDTNEAYVP
jgi:N-acetylneuraminic acid mutarotase